ncbi:MAG: hypothetical protein A3F83_07725 [Candidatus Glassbacteria bacterium RIFCSPLOWO2_12_FULL_58_11]|uniref:SH3b domain-containing protein n=1 Tax=Candidatus Glassbacteria bacterium RIFCSPLOWO2_12_FULL_58_11 TaxID=1817867 RepID=A0A1F5YZ91_9BACT|nr:MAG: hypothetical protein A3F83_07725 [Candidatus Glassbacteria bacterium RIFCSPLOWO2_12_FULL_58_11]
MYVLKNKILGLLRIYLIPGSMALAPLYAQQAQAPADTAGKAAAAAPADTSAEVMPPAAIMPAGPANLITTNQFDIAAGYNLKITVRLAPVYQDSTLTSEIIAYLPRGSVVGVLSVQETWYKIDFGEENARQQGWVISYGVERTLELEHIVTNREDINRWAGMQVIVTAGETPVRSFPSNGAEILLRSYRNEIFNIAGESEDYYMVELSNAVKGWAWKGDVQIYTKPKYTREQVREMVRTARERDSRMTELNNLLADLKARNQKVDKELALLEPLLEKVRNQAASASQTTQRKPFFQFDSLKNRSALRLGMLKQGFGPKLGLASTTFKGIAYNYRPSDKLSFDLEYLSGKPTALEPGANQAGLPSSIAGLDTLNISAKFLQFGLRYSIGGLRRVPILSRMDNFLSFGIGHLRINSHAAGVFSTQSLWGPILGWEFSHHLFSKIDIEMGLKYFLTRAEVTDVRFSGTQLLSTQKVFLRNRAFYFGGTWDF